MGESVGGPYRSRSMRSRSGWIPVVTALLAATGMTVTAPGVRSDPRATAAAMTGAALIDGRTTWRHSPVAARGWRTSQFDAAGWERARGDFGARAANRLPPSRAHHFRTRFRATPTEAAGTLRLRVRSGPVVILLNGRRVAVTSSPSVRWREFPLPVRTVRPGVNTLAARVTRSRAFAVRLSVRPAQGDQETDQTAPPTPVETTPPDPSPTDPAIPTPRALCRIDDPRLPEISGMAASRRHPDIVWVHNDSGDVARVFALHTGSCDVAAEVRLEGVIARDFEAMAMGVDEFGQPEMWIGDIGDNGRVRAEVALHRLVEPSELSDQSLPVRTVRVSWSDGARDSETLLVDPIANGPVWLVSKEPTGGVYPLVGDFRTSGVAVTGARIRDVAAAASDGAIAPDRQATVVRHYNVAYLSAGLPPETGVRLELPAQRQGEAVTFTADGRSLLIATEGVGDLVEVPVR